MASSIAGGAGNDTLTGTSSDETIYGYGGNDSISAGKGDDTAYGGDGRDTIDGGDGDDSLYGDAGNDSVLGGKGSDRIYAGTGDDTLTGGDGSDFLFGEAGNDLLTGGNDAWDELYGGDGNDTIISGNANDNWAYGGTGDDSVTMGTGWDLAYGGAGNDSLFGGSGNDTLHGGADNDSVMGGTGSDTLTGGTGKDTLDGGADADGIRGGAGNDLIYGGSGNDTLEGDTHSMSVPDCYSTGSATGTQTFVNSAPVSVNLYWINTQGTAVFVTTLAPGASITQPGGAGYNWMLTETASGTTLDHIEGSASNASYSYGPNFDDTIYGGDGSDQISGNFGNDLLYGDAGNDTILGGVGNDTVVGGIGDDSITLGDGDDVMDDWSNNGGNDTVFGGAGNDLIYGGGENDLIYGGDGNDTLSGGAGIDSIYGGAGNDIAVIGNDHGSDFYDLGETAGDFDQLDFGNYLDSSGVLVTFTGSDQGSYAYQGSQATGQFLGAEGVLGTDYNDTINAGSDTDGVTVYGMGGSDLVTGGTGNDLIDGGAGNDTLEGGDGADSLYGGTGDDVLSGGAGNDVLMAGNDSNDTDSLFGGAGNDYLDAQRGAGGYLDGGDGADTLHVGSDHSANTIVGGEGGIDSDSLMLRNYGGNTGGANIVFTGDEAGSGTFGSGTLSFSQIEIVNGSSGDDRIDASQSNASQTLIGNDGDDNLIGGHGDDALSGGEGNDTLVGADGADQLDGGDGHDFLRGGTGNDTLSGGAGQDVFVFDQNSGHDMVTDFDMKLEDGHTIDQLDVSDLTNADGSPLRWQDITVQTDPFGNAVLIFPEGETVVLSGVDSHDINKQTAHQMGMPCFAAGTLIATPQGQRLVQDLRAGDQVLTPKGPMPVAWAGGRTIGAAELTARPSLQPVIVRQGALGNVRPLILSRQHALAIAGPDGPVLVRAAQLAALGQGAFRQARGRLHIAYHHLLLPQHTLVCANGAWVETLWPGPAGLSALGPTARAEIALALPQLATALVVPALLPLIYGPRALPALRTANLRRLGRILPPGQLRTGRGPAIATPA